MGLKLNLNQSANLGTRIDSVLPHKMYNSSTIQYKGSNHSLDSNYVNDNDFMLSQNSYGLNISNQDRLESVKNKYTFQRKLDRKYKNLFKPLKLKI